MKLIHHYSSEAARQCAWSISDQVYAAIQRRVQTLWMGRQVLHFQV